MEVGNNVGSWVSPTNQKRIGEGLERMFLDENGRIKRAITGDRMKLARLEKEFSFFKAKRRNLGKYLDKNALRMIKSQAQPIKQ